MFTRFALRLSIIAAASFAALPAAVGAQSGIMPAAKPGDPSPVDPSTTFYACYVPNSGTVYRIKAANTPAACTRPTHVEFSWNAATAPGFSQVFVVISDEVWVPANSFGAAIATCPEGTTLLNGGYALSVDATSVPVVQASLPHPYNSNAWLVNVGNLQPDAKTIQVFAHATCAL